ncbi:MAG: Crp/Fnr family transcriptional regulator [Eubacterium sp.]
MKQYNIFPFWKKLTDEEKQQVSNECYKEIYEKGTIMHKADDTCKGLMAVVSGQLRVYILSDEGREVTLFRVNTGEVCVLSASCLMDTIDFDVLIEANEKTEVIVLPSICLNKIIINNVYAELYMHKAATEKFSNVMWTMQQILFKKIDQRIAGLILDEANRNNTSELKITHDEIAKYIGSAREVVTKALKYLAEYDVIELQRGKIIVKDKEKLKKFI